jgi:circularly permuted ATPgrasp domain protein
VPDLVRYYLHEEPVLGNVETWRLDTPENMAYVLAHLSELVIKPVEGSGGKGIVIGPHTTKEQLERLATVVSKEPRSWIAQRPVWLSTVPTMVGQVLAPRHVDLRPFAVNDGRDVWVLPGGLTRVALPEGSLIVNSSQGGGSKDTWVLAPPGGMPTESPPPGPTEPEATAAKLRGSNLNMPDADLPEGAAESLLIGGIPSRPPAHPPDQGPTMTPIEQQQQQQQARHA